MVEKLSALEMVGRQRDKKMISQILGENTIDQPGSWNKPYKKKITEGLSCAENLVYEIGLISLGRYEPEEIKKYLIKHRDRTENFELALVKAVVVAECIPDELTTLEIQDWLKTFRGKKSVIKNTRHKEVISQAMGFTNQPTKSFTEISGDFGKYSAWSSIIQRECVRKLAKRYENLIKQAF